MAHQGREQRLIWFRWIRRLVGPGSLTGFVHLGHGDLFPHHIQPFLLVCPVIGVHVVLIIVDAGIKGKLIGLIMDVDLFLRDVGLDVAEVEQANGQVSSPSAVKWQ